MKYATVLDHAAVINSCLPAGTTLRECLFVTLKVGRKLELTDPEAVVLTEHVLLASFTVTEKD